MASGLTLENIFSLNREKRQRELLRVTKENQQILNRITMREPEYSQRAWESDWRSSEKLMDNIGRYPKNWWKIIEKQVRNDIVK